MPDDVDAEEQKGLKFQKITEVVDELKIVAIKEESTEQKDSSSVTEQNSGP